MSTLSIKDLHVSVRTETESKPILRGVSLDINSGECHAIMGPNGSGKSTLAMAIMGHPKYEISEGSIHLDGTDLVDLSVDERARAGLFLGMQHPVEVQGVSVSNFLRTAKTAISGEAPNLRKWIGELKSNMENLEIDPRFATRDVNSGFSGGEKKRFEILSMEVLEPALGILDEIDSGLDIDALKAVSEGINRTKSETKTGILLITHYTRILKYVVPDKVHVFVDGRIAETGGPELGDQLEAEGYERYQRIATL
jgi:Fe-S cluster assembly ATP-binding protein